MPRGHVRNPKHPIDRGAPASVIAEKFGGIKLFAQALTEVRAARGAKAASFGMVHRWMVVGTIDMKHHADVNAAAKLRNVRLKPLDFLDTRKPAPVASPAEIEVVA